MYANLERIRAEIDTSVGDDVAEEPLATIRRTGVADRPDRFSETEPVLRRDELRERECGPCAYLHVRVGIRERRGLRPRRFIAIEPYPRRHLAVMVNAPSRQSISFDLVQ
ncbi:MAG: hypothetical protein F4117_07805 [Acidimicrobiales bacterium]|nr:hypothetical protein [Acidimicrobiales bacterium]MXX44263.1 hypothetical protein [Acidimicrobiales bacterium]MXZ16006.1 hypothetical protein [Acidimicrobiales bacterium]MYA26651.1 hypothetical protein [Acidimicrobiales bacterium]MYB81360.1 hypothetical protein [Acidimicrobiales bacterium]